MNRPEEAIIEEINRVVEEFTEEQSIEAWNKYCSMNGYEEIICNLSDETIDNLFDDSEIADYVIDYDDDCDDSELRELLDELAEVREC